MGYSQKKLIEGIFEGQYSKYMLPDFLFLYTYEELVEEINKVFTSPESKVSVNITESFKYNLTTFAGAKTFHEVDMLSKFLIDENGFKLTFKEFQEIASGIDDTYNSKWLKTEQDTSFGQAQSAESWKQYEEEKEIFPLLQYKTALDERVREEHAAWDNLIFPVDHPFWDTRMPLNGYNCRCRVIQLTDGKVSSENGVPENPDEVFSNNAGKTGEVFTKKHPYYKVRKEDKPLTRNNFGLGFDNLKE